jgi:TPR repeat protein
MKTIFLNQKSNGLPVNWSALVLLLFFLVPVSGSGQLKRYALVIGAQSYTSLPPLKNSINDASAISSLLTEKGFKVEYLPEPKTKAVLKEAITRYFLEMKDQSNAVGIIYYAGHGLQFEGKNYIIPTSANLQNPGDLSDQCIDMTIVMDVLKASKYSLNILLLDACRSLPSFSRDSDEGLAKMYPPEGSIVVFAAQPGKKASDGNEDHGLFTSKLIIALNKKDLTITDVFKTVKQEVYEASNKIQLPSVVDNSTGGDFYINEPSTKPQTEQIARQEITSSKKSVLKSVPETKGNSVQASQKKVITKEELLTEQINKLVEQKSYFEAKRQLEPMIGQNNPRALALMANLYFYGLGVNKDQIQSFKMNETSALSGDKIGQHQLGLMYLNGWGVIKNEPEGLSWLEKSAEAGNISAISSLGEYYLLQKKYAPSIDWYKKGALLEDNFCKYRLGLFYLEGRGVDKNYSDALKWFTSAKDFDLAMVTIGKMYENGLGVPKDNQEAIKWYHSAALKGSQYGLFQIGRVYEDGVGVTKNLEEAITNYKKSAEIGSVESMYRLGIIYSENNGPGYPNYSQTTFWMERAANAGMIGAGQYLANFYSTDGNYKSDFQEERWLKWLAEEKQDPQGMFQYGSFLSKRQQYLDCIKWFEKSSDAGYVIATNNLGVLYNSGIGVDRDLGKAMTYFKKAAQLGLPVAMYNTGYLYETSKTFGKNKEEAIKWYQAALDKGFEGAKERLDKLSKR